MTRKEFREILNQRFPFNPNDQGKGERGRYKATKRPYGDYLYRQDREMFEIDYQEELKRRGA